MYTLFNKEICPLCTLIVKSIILFVLKMPFYFPDNQ